MDRKLSCIIVTLDGILFSTNSSTFFFTFLFYLMVWSTSSWRGVLGRWTTINPVEGQIAFCSFFGTRARVAKPITHNSRYCKNIFNFYFFVCKEKIRYTTHGPLVPVIKLFIVRISSLLALLIYTLELQ